MQQRGELGEVDDVIEHEELVEGNLEPIGDGSVGIDEVDQSVELRCAREGGQLVNRRKVESRKGFPRGEAREMETVGIQETRNQNIRVRTGPFQVEHQRKPTEFASKANLAEDGWKDQGGRLGRRNRRCNRREGEEMDEGGERNGSVCHL